MASIRSDSAGKYMVLTAAEVKALEKVHSIVDALVQELPKEGLNHDGRWQLDQLLTARISIKNLTRPI